MRKFIIGLTLFITVKSVGQDADKPFIHLQEPAKQINNVKSSRQFIIGSTCKNCSLTVNGQAVKVYPTGAFAFELNLKTGDSAFNIIASSAPDKSVDRKLQYNYSLPKPPDTLKALAIASIEIFPEGNLFVQPGDLIKIKVKSLTGCTVTANGKIPLYEMPVTATNSMPGIYQGEYVIKEKDSFLVAKLRISVTNKLGKNITGESKTWISMFGPLAPNVAVTKGRLAHLLFGLGEDRLGGAKIGDRKSVV